MYSLDLIMYIELDSLCIFLLFYIMFKSSRYIERRQSWYYFQYSLCFITLFLVSDLVWTLMEYHVIINVFPLPYLVNSAYFIFSVLGTSYWLFYTEAELESPFTKKLIFRIIGYIPIIVMIVLLIVSYFNGCLFYFDEDVNYIRGPYNILSFITPLTYLVVAVIHPLTKAFHKKHYINKKHYLFLSIFALITIVASILQIFIPGTPLPCIGITMASLLVYMNNQQLLVSIDPLTKINNRYHMIRYLTTKMEHIDETNNLFLLIIDVDKFKYVNDTYGHVEGDNALLCIASTLKLAASTFNCFVSRYGGDEFIIIFETSDENELQSLCQFIHQNIKDGNQKNNRSYRLSVSIGYAKYSANIKYVPDFIAMADQNLYQVKQRRADAQ